MSLYGHNPALLHALLYARRDWRVVPLHSVDADGCECRRSGCTKPGKHPRIRDWPNRGSLDADQIRSWWETWPTSNVGIVTGPAGLAVFDIDPGRGGEQTFEARTAGHPFPRVPTVFTGGGGLHFYFTGRERSGTDVLGSGVDLKSSGGLVVAPPSLHISGERYCWLVEDAEPVPIPGWLIPATFTVPELSSDSSPHRPGPYVEAAVRTELETVATAPIGSRNKRLHRAAFALSRFVASGQLSRDIAEDLIAAAVHAGQTNDEARRVVKSSFGKRGVVMP